MCPSVLFWGGLHLNHIVFQTKDLISTIIVFGFLEIRGNSVAVDDNPYQNVFWIKSLDTFLKYDFLTLVVRK